MYVGILSGLRSGSLVCITFAILVMRIHLFCNSERRVTSRFLYKRTPILTGGKVVGMNVVGGSVGGAIYGTLYTVLDPHSPPGPQTYVYFGGGPWNF